MENVQKMLDQAIEELGLGHTITIMLSQRRDKEIVAEQRKRVAELKSFNGCTS